MFGHVDDALLLKFFMWDRFDAKRNLKVSCELLERRHTDRAVIFFPYWTGKASLYQRFVDMLPNHTLVFYDYPNEVLSSDVKVSLSYIREILDDARAMILRLRKEGYREITLVGSSFGSNLALALASTVPVEKVVLNTIDRSFAKEIFSSRPLWKLKSHLQKRGFTLKKLEQIYAFLNNEKNLLRLKNKKTRFLIFISVNDIFCSRAELEPLMKVMNRRHLRYAVYESSILGHILTIFKNIRFNKRMISFIGL